MSIGIATAWLGGCSEVRARVWRFVVAALPLLLLGPTSMIFSSGDTFRTLSTHPLRWTVAHRVVLLPVIAIMSLAYLLFKGRRPLALRVPLLLYGAYVMLAAVSVAFSPNPGYSAFKVLEISAAILAVCSVVKTLGTEQTLRTFLWVVFGLLVLVWVGVAVSPELGLAIEPFRDLPFPYWLNGWLIGIDGNTVGMMAAILLLSTSFLAGQWPRAARYAWITVLAVTLVFAQSRTSVVALAVGALLLQVGRPRRLVVRDFVLAAILLGVLLMFTNFDTIGNYVTKGMGWESEEVATFSGRLDQWVYALDQMKGHWLWGFGYAAGGRALLEDYGMQASSTLLNAYVDAAVSVGFLGPLLLAAALIGGYLMAFRARRTDTCARCALALLGAMTVRSLTGPTFAIGLMEPALFAALLLCLGDSSRSAEPVTPERLPDDVMGQAMPGSAVGSSST